jgi:hypothetical protein
MHPRAPRACRAEKMAIRRPGDDKAKLIIDEGGIVYRERVDSVERTNKQMRLT